MSEPEIVAGYFRVSHARDEMRAPELYAEEITSYCSYRKLTLAKTYSDIDFSGYNQTRNRPGLSALIEARHRYAAVVVPKLSRFGRSLAHLIELFETFETDGIALVFLDVGIDTTTSQGRLLRHIMAAFAEYESDVKSDYARATERMLAREGRPHGPMAPFGYEVTGRRAERSYVIDPPAAAIVRSMFSDYLEGRSLNALALELNERGVTGPKGGGRASESRPSSITPPTPASASTGVKSSKPAGSRWCRGSSGTRSETCVTALAPPTTILRGAPTPYWLACWYAGSAGRNFHHGRANDRGDIYRCFTGEATPHRCGGQITARKAERLVTDAVFQVLALARDQALEQRAAQIRRNYPAAKIAERRALLGEVAERVVVVARPPDNRHRKGTAIGRSLEVTWSRAWSLGSFGYVGATSLLTPRRPSVQSPVGKSWKQWRELRILAPTSASGGKRS